jgi:hypothetical protein
MLLCVVASAASAARGIQHGDADVLVLDESLKVKWLWVPAGAASSRRSGRNPIWNQTPSVHENSTRETSADDPYDTHGELRPKRAFEARVKNVGTKAIAGVGWRYEYAYAERGSAELTWRAESFATTVKLKPGATARLRGEIEGLGELRSIVARGGGKAEIEPPANERVTITVVIYADGTRWQSE